MTRAAPAESAGAGATHTVGAADADRRPGPGGRALRRARDGASVHTWAPARRPAARPLACA
ncbi:hypothetical protein ACPA9J_32390 [Pseudomonas aeruginosa]